jgi:hypothetical protein
MDKLKQLMARCACSVCVEVNPHRDTYDTVEQWIENTLAEVSDDVRADMIRLNTVVDVQFYPDTPVGSLRVVHYDLDSAVDAALACFDN